MRPFDVYPGPSGLGATPIGSLAGEMVFSATDPLHGQLVGEPWITVGTSAVLLADINPGGSGSAPAPGVVVSGVLYFSAFDSVRGRELWRTDGTPQGTRQVVDLAPGSASSDPRKLATLNGDVYFFAGQSSALDLWRTDGTTSGTALVRAGIAPASSDLVAAGALLFFVGTDAATGDELWCTDGTPAGTRMVVDLNPGPVSSWPVAVQRFGNEVVFGATHPRFGTEVWRSDGSAAGTLLVVDAYPGLGSGFAGRFKRSLAVSGSSIAFTGVEPFGGYELWCSDGTPGGSRSLDLLPGVSSSWPEDVVAGPNGTFLFTAENGRIGREPWVTDGTPAGTRGVDVWSGPASSSPSRLTASAGSTPSLFAADDGVRGLEAWSFDGRSVALVADIESVPFGATQDSSPQMITEFGELALFSADDGVHGREIWVSDGTSTGTVLLADTQPRGSPGPSFMAVAQTQAFYFSQAVPGPPWNRLWRTDGSPAGTRPVPAPTGVDFEPQRFQPTAWRDLVLVVAHDPFATGSELWRSDGTASGTYVLADMTTGLADTLIAGVQPLRDRLLILTSSGAGRELWSTDGTGAGTRRVRSWQSQVPGVGWLGVIGGVALFSMDDAASGLELWRTDGTAVGTTQVADVNPLGSSSPRLLSTFGGRIVFSADDGSAGKELWITDATSGGTVRLADLEPGPVGSMPRVLGVGGSRMLIDAGSASSAEQLWVSDGTPVGTVPASSVFSGQRPVRGAVAGKLPGGVVLVESDSGGLWFWDGMRFALLHQPSSNQRWWPFEVLPVGARHAFVHMLVDGAMELWRTDGTALGTGLVLATQSAGGTTAPVNALVGGRLLVSARDPVLGRELTVIDPGATSQSTGVGCGSVLGTPPRMEGVTDPVLAGALVLDVAGRVSGAAGLLLVGVPGKPSLARSPACYSHLAAAPLVAWPAMSTANGFRAQLPVPNSPALLGVRIVAHAVSGVVGVPGSFAMSNPVRATLGR